MKQKFKRECDSCSDVSSEGVVWRIDGGPEKGVFSCQSCQDISSGKKKLTKSQRLEHELKCHKKRLQTIDENTPDGEFKDKIISITEEI